MFCSRRRWSDFLIGVSLIGVKLDDIGAKKEEVIDVINDEEGV
jgi:hypothetical protein